MRRGENYVFWGGREGYSTLLSLTFAEIRNVRYWEEVAAQAVREQRRGATGAVS
jgi:xylose isomerase